MTNVSTSAIDWLECILAERFGQKFTIEQSDGVMWLGLPEAAGSICFDVRLPEFQESRSDFHCGEWDPAAEGWNSVLGKPIPAPGLAELQQPLIEQSSDNTHIHYDILGLTYWMLSRLEEVGRTDLDEHNRFPATSSHAFQHGYLERPIVDEWLDILGQVICRQWPGIELRQHRFEIKVSHDVDNPSRYGLQSAKRLVRGMGGDVLKRRDVLSAMRAPWIWLNTHDRLHRHDPFNTFDWIMGQSDAHGLTSAFYFICGRTDPERDAQYEPEQPLIRALMRRIHERGHEIGLHPSYNTYQSPEQIKHEADRLRRICTEEGIEQATWGGRMHFLRWEQPTTLCAWDKAMMNYDSTLGYADRPGFRCGSCFEYPAFDSTGQEQLRLRIRPLIAMECTVVAQRYMALSDGKEALDEFSKLKDTCRKVNGCFTLLWHNSQLTSRGMKNLYREIMFK